MAIEIVNFPIKNGDFPELYKRLPEGTTSLKPAIALRRFISPWWRCQLWGMATWLPPSPDSKFGAGSSSSDPNPGKLLPICSMVLEYSPTFGCFLRWMWVNVPYMEHMGYDIVYGISSGIFIYIYMDVMCILVFLVYSDILAGIYFDIVFGNLSSIILSGIFLSGICSDSLSSIYSDILSDPLSGILPGIPSAILFGGCFLACISTFFLTCFFGIISGILSGNSSVFYLALVSSMHFFWHSICILFDVLRACVLTFFTFFFSGNLFVLFLFFAGIFCMYSEIFWHFLWHSIWHSIWHLFCFLFGICFGMSSNIPSDSLSCIYSDMFFGILTKSTWHLCRHCSGIYFGNLCGIYSDSLSVIHLGILFDTVRIVRWSSLWLWVHKADVELPIADVQSQTAPEILCKTYLEVFLRWWYTQIICFNKSFSF